jgi:hypothetical protein
MLCLCHNLGLNCICAKYFKFRINYRYHDRSHTISFSRLDTIKMTLTCVIDVCIARIRDEMVVTQQAITALHATFQADLDKQQQRYARLERELLEAVSAKERALEEREKHMELSTQRITTTVTTNKIKLDVGGRYFSVTLDMMLKYPNSFFARLFSGRWEDQIGSDGAYYINRSGDHFHHVVNFLRDGGLDVSLSEDHRALCREADFY